MLHEKGPPCRAVRTECSGVRPAAASGNDAANDSARAITASTARTARSHLPAALATLRMLCRRPSPGDRTHPLRNQDAAAVELKPLSQVQP
jgi:hypothetical protein